MSYSPDHRTFRTCDRILVREIKSVNIRGYLGGARRETADIRARRTRFAVLAGRERFNAAEISQFSQILALKFCLSRYGPENAIPRHNEIPRVHRAALRVMSVVRLSVQQRVIRVSVVRNKKKKKT